MLICEVRRAEEGGVCYVLEVDEKEKLVPVSDSLTHILTSLFGEGVNINHFTVDPSN